MAKIRCTIAKINQKSKKKNRLIGKDIILVGVVFNFFFSRYIYISFFNKAGETFPEGQIGKMGKTAMKILSLKDEEFYEVIFDVIRMAFNTELAACVIQKTCDVDKKYFIILLSNKSFILHVRISKRSFTYRAFRKNSGHFSQPNSRLHIVASSNRNAGVQSLLLLSERLI